MPEHPPYNERMSIKPIDFTKRSHFETQLLEKAMPPNSLGRLGKLALSLAMIKEGPLDRMQLLLFAGDHGVIEEQVTHSPQEITYQQCLNFAAGGGACSLFARLNDIELKVIDVGVAQDFPSTSSVVNKKVAYGTKNFLKEPAMTKDECYQAMQVGKEMVKQASDAGIQAIAFGEMGVGNTTSASALAAVITGHPVPQITGKGSGLSDEELEHKIQVIEKGIVLHPERDPISLLCNLGSFEIAAICGGMLEAAERSVPILLDGFVVTSAALVAKALDRNVCDYLIACHRSGMEGHALMLQALGCAEPVLDLQMQLGEGTGSLVAWPVVRLASHILTDMTSFENAQVTDSTKLLQTLGLV